MKILFNINVSSSNKFYFVYKNTIFKIFYKLKQNNIFYYIPKRNLLLPPRKSNFDYLKTSKIIDSKFKKMIGDEQLDAPFKSNLRPENFYEYYYKLKKKVILRRLLNIKNNKQPNLLPREPYPNFDPHYWDWRSSQFFKWIRKFVFYDCKEGNYFNYKNRFKISKYYNFIYKNGNSYLTLDKKLLKKILKMEKNKLLTLSDGIWLASSEILNPDSKLLLNNLDFLRIYYYFLFKFFSFVKKIFFKLESLNIKLKHVFSLSNVYLDLFNYYKKKKNFLPSIADKYFLKYNWDFISLSKVDSLTNSLNLNIKYLYNSKIDIRKNQLKWTIHYYPNLMSRSINDFKLRNFKCPEYIIGMYDIEQDIHLDFITLNKIGVVLNYRMLWKKFGSVFRRICSNSTHIFFDRNYKYVRGPIAIDFSFLNVQKSTVNFEYKYRYLIDKYMYAKKRRLAFSTIPVEKLKKPWLLPSKRLHHRFSHNLPEYWIKTIGFVICRYINNFFPKQDTFLRYRIYKKTNFFSFYKNLFFCNYPSPLTTKNNTVIFNSSEGILADTIFFNIFRILRSSFYYIDWLNFSKLNSISNFFNQFLCRNQLEADLSIYLYKSREIICLLNKYNNPSFNSWTIYKFIEFFGNFFLLNISNNNISIENKLIYSYYCDLDHFFFLKKSFLYFGQKFSLNSYLYGLGNILINIENNFIYLAFLFKPEFDEVENFSNAIMFNIDFFNLKKILRLLDLFLESVNYSFKTSYMRWKRNRKGKVIRETTRNLWINTYRNSKYNLVRLFKRSTKFFFPKFTFLKKFYENGFKLNNLHNFYNSFSYSSIFFWPVSFKEYDVYNNKIDRYKFVKYIAYFNFSEEKDEDQVIEKIFENVDSHIYDDDLSETPDFIFNNNFFIKYIINYHKSEILLSKMNNTKISSFFFKGFFSLLSKNYLFSHNSKVDCILLFFLLNTFSYFFLISLFKKDLISFIAWKGLKNNFFFISEENEFDYTYKSINHKIEKLLQYWFLPIFGDNNIIDNIDYFPIFLKKFKLILNRLRNEDFKINFLNSNFFRKNKIFADTLLFSLDKNLRTKDFYSKTYMLYVVNNTPTSAVKTTDFQNFSPTQLNPFLKLSLGFNSYDYSYESDTEHGYNVKTTKKKNDNVMARVLKKIKTPVLTMEAFQEFKKDLHKGYKRSKWIKERIKITKFKFFSNVKHVAKLTYNLDTDSKYLFLLKKNKYEAFYDLKRIKYDHKFLIKNKISSLIKDNKSKDSKTYLDYLADKFIDYNTEFNKNMYDLEEEYELNNLEFNIKKVIKKFIDYKINNPFTMTAKAAKTCFYANLNSKRRSYYLINNFRLSSRTFNNYKSVIERKKQLLNVLQNKNVPWLFKNFYFYNFNLWNTRFDLYNNYTLGFDTNKKFRNDGIELHNYYRKRENRLNLKTVHYFDIKLPRVKYQRKNDPDRNATIKLIKEHHNASIYVFSKKIYIAAMLNKMQTKVKNKFCQLKNLTNRKNKILEVIDRRKKNYLNLNSIFYKNFIFNESNTNYLIISTIQKNYFIFLNKIRNIFSITHKLRSQTKHKKSFLIDNPNIFIYRGLLREELLKLTKWDWRYTDQDARCRKADQKYESRRFMLFLWNKSLINFIKDFKNPALSLIRELAINETYLHYQACDETVSRVPRWKQRFRTYLVAAVPIIFYKKFNYISSSLTYRLPFINKTPKVARTKPKRPRVLKRFKTSISRRIKNKHRALHFFYGGTLSPWSCHQVSDDSPKRSASKSFLYLKRWEIWRYLTVYMLKRYPAKTCIFPYFSGFFNSKKKLRKVNSLIKEENIKGTNKFKKKIQSNFANYWYYLNLSRYNRFLLKPFTNSKMWWILLKEKLANSNFNKYINLKNKDISKDKINFNWNWSKIDSKVKTIFLFCTEVFDSEILTVSYNDKNFIFIQENNLNQTAPYNDYFEIDDTTKKSTLPIYQQIDMIDSSPIYYRLLPTELEFLYDYEELLKEESKITEDPKWVYQTEEDMLEKTDCVLNASELGLVINEAEDDKRFDNEKEVRIRSWDLDEQNPVNIRKKEIAENWEIYVNMIRKRNRKRSGYKDE